VSETIKEDFKKIFSWEKPIDVIYNTVESDVIKEKSQEAVEDIVFNKDEINLVSVAKLMHTKGYDRLVNITKRLKDDGFPVHTYIVGKGEEKAALEKQIAECGIESNWTFVGFQSNPYKYVKAADLYVCSSRREGFSTAVTESLIIGTPVVSTNCSGAYELLGYNNEYGIVTENEEESLYQGIKRMLEGENLAYYRQKAQERGGEFNAEKTVQSAENMFKEVFNV
jgi:glycosyltransferase involved in cell wall biosynthesis